MTGGGAIILRWLRIVGNHLLGMALFALGALVGWRLIGQFPWEPGKFEGNVEGGIYTLYLLIIFTLSCIPGYLLLRVLVWRRWRLKGISDLLRPFIAGLISIGCLILFISIVNQFAPPNETGFIMLFIVSPLLAVLAAAWLVSLIPLRKSDGKDKGSIPLK